MSERQKQRIEAIGMAAGALRACRDLANDSDEEAWWDSLVNDVLGRILDGAGLGEADSLGLAEALDMFATAAPGPVVDNAAPLLRDLERARKRARKMERR